MMGAHYGRITKCIKDTIKDTVPPKQPLRYNGRKVSTDTKRLYDLSIRDFASGRKIEISDRDSWNRALSIAAMQDYEAWAEAWVTRMELADERGDILTVHQGAKTLTMKSKIFTSSQPTSRTKTKAISSNPSKSWGICGENS